MRTPKGSYENKNGDFNSGRSTKVCGGGHSGSSSHSTADKSSSPSASAGIAHAHNGIAQSKNSTESLDQEVNITNKALSIRLASSDYSNNANAGNSGALP